MEFVWVLKEETFKEYKKRQRRSSHTEEGSYIGAVRTGELCFDIMDYGNHLWFDLYVGGVATRYGYSVDGYYPYDFCGEVSFKWEKELLNTSYESFKQEIEIFIQKYLSDRSYYITDPCQICVNLIEKANNELRIW